MSSSYFALPRSGSPAYAHVQTHSDNNSCELYAGGKDPMFTGKCSGSLSTNDFKMVTNEGPVITCSISQCSGFPKSK